MSSRLPNPGASRLSIAPNSIKPRQLVSIASPDSNSDHVSLRNPCASSPSYVSRYVIPHQADKKLTFLTIVPSPFPTRPAISKSRRSGEPPTHNERTSREYEGTRCIPWWTVCSASAASWDYEQAVVIVEGYGWYDDFLRFMAASKVLGEETIASSAANQQSGKANENETWRGFDIVYYTVNNKRHDCWVRWQECDPCCRVYSRWLTVMVIWKWSRLTTGETMSETLRTGTLPW